MGLSAVQLLRVGGDAIPPLQPQAVDRRLRIRRFQVRRRHLNALPLQVRPQSKVSSLKKNHLQINAGEETSRDQEVAYRTIRAQEMQKST